jgi:hypothetical protein
MADQTSEFKQAIPPTGAETGRLRQAASVTLEERVVQPENFPANPSASMAMLQQGLQFVADGADVTPEFLQQLQRMLSQWQARTDLAGVVMRHHSMSRYHKLALAIERGETIMFDPNQLLALTPDQMIKVLGMMYGESHALRKMLDPGEPDQPPVAEPILQSADPALLAARSSAMSDARGASMQTRQMVRAVLAKVLANAGLQAEPAPTPTQGAVLIKDVPAKPKAKAKIRVVAKAPPKK